MVLLPRLTMLIESCWDLQDGNCDSVRVPSMLKALFGAAFRLLMKPRVTPTVWIFRQTKQR